MEKISGCQGLGIEGRMASRDSRRGLGGSGALLDLRFGGVTHANKVKTHRTVQSNEL